ncbi:MAG: hypothetical protein OXI24_16560 [Candidatus Poribacteria bacterium]|nr:hypothetical protein [Candidatus Poribacteria bacterium]
MKRVLRKRRAKADKRRQRVRALRDQGFSAPKILEILTSEGITVKLKTIYDDFTKLNAERENSENAKQNDTA